VAVAEPTLERLERLFADYRARAVSWCERDFRDPALAEDAVQEAFIEIARRMERGDELLGQNGDEAMVRRNVRWAAHKILARQKALAARELRASTPVGLDQDAAWVRMEAREFLRQLWPTLSASHRQVLYLRFLEDGPDALTAKQLGVSVKAVRSRSDRALASARMAAAHRARPPVRSRNPR
jgi:RNA polymerase sigma factor (sigma-70 family)